MAQVNLGRVVGYSAYEIAVQNGFIGTEAEWLASLQGADGADGAPGQNGQDGAPGAAATITVGTTSTGTAGSAASVVNVGTTSAAILNFTIPQGATGPAGSYTAGSNITISEGTISAIDTTYTAGTGIDITNGVISATATSSYGDNDVMSLIHNVYGAAPGTEQWDSVSVEVTYESGTTRYTVVLPEGETFVENHDYEIVLTAGSYVCNYFWNSESNVWIFTDTSTWTDYDIATTANVGEYLVNIPSGVEEDFTLEQNFPVQAPSAPFNGWTIPVDGSTIGYDDRGDVIYVTNPVPTTTLASAGDVLTVSAGSAVWAAPQGGGATYSAGNGIVIDANNTISTEYVNPIITVGGMTNLSSWTATDKQTVAAAITGHKPVTICEFDSGSTNQPYRFWRLNDVRKASNKYTGKFVLEQPIGNRYRQEVELTTNYGGGNVDTLSIHNYPVLPETSSLVANQLIAVNSSANGLTCVDALPSCPTTTDGTYMLVATVSSGSVAYEWQAVSTASGNSF